MSRATDLISQIENDLQRVKKEYIFFFNGNTLVEPYELRERMMRKVRELTNLTKLKSSEMFRADNLIAKVNSHVSLWERQLQEKLGARRGRPKKADAAASAENAQAAKPAAGSTPRRIAISNATSERDQVVALYDEYTRTNLNLGVKTRSASRASNPLSSNKRSRSRNARAVRRLSTRSWSKTIRRRSSQRVLTKRVISIHL